MNDPHVQKQKCRKCGAPMPDLVVPRDVYEVMTKITLPRVRLNQECDDCKAAKPVTRPNASP